MGVTKIRAEDRSPFCSKLRMRACGGWLWTRAALIVCALTPLSCGSTQKWSGDNMARPEIIAREISPELLEHPLRDEMPNFPPPGHLRPCCAFGTDLHVSLMSVPVPWLALSNVVGVDDLGPHKYDNGALSIEGSRPGALPFNDEHNGLVYTCRGGFIDTAHLRDWADWTLYLGAQIARTLETGTTIELADEGARRRIVTRAIDPAILARHAPRDIAIPLAQWLAFQMSIWHEIATWYGWSTLPFFSEEASAFSPEDLYSNLLGSKMAGILVYQYAVTSEAAYNENMNTAVRLLIQRFGAVPAKVGVEALRGVDGVWWDSKIALPAKTLLRRRNFQVGTELTPWLVAQAPVSNPAKRAVAEVCAGENRPIVLHNPDTCASELVRFDAIATFEIEVGESIAARFPFPRAGSRQITQADFPAVIAQIRAENALEFGAYADRPD